MARLPIISRKTDHNASNGIIDANKIAKDKLWAQKELHRLGNIKRAPHWHRLNVEQKVASGLCMERWHWLIDYRNGNKRILKRALTRLQAYNRNKFLAGSGKAWALCTD